MSLPLLTEARPSPADTEPSDHPREWDLPHAPTHGTEAKQQFFVEWEVPEAS